MWFSGWQRYPHYPYSTYQSSSHTDPEFAGKSCGFQSGSKIVDLGFVKFKSNDTKANRTLEQIQKTQGATKIKAVFFCFPWEFSMDFSRKSNEDDFSQKSNGGWIFLGSKLGLKININNMIRLAPARIESGRGK